MKRRNVSPHHILQCSKNTQSNPFSNISPVYWKKTCRLLSYWGQHKDTGRSSPEAEWLCLGANSISSSECIVGVKIRCGPPLPPPPMMLLQSEEVGAGELMQLKILTSCERDMEKRIILSPLLWNKHTSMAIAILKGFSGNLVVHFQHVWGLMRHRLEKEWPKF